MMLQITRCSVTASSRFVFSMAQIRLEFCHRNSSPSTKILLLLVHSH